MLRIFFIAQLFFLTLIILPVNAIAAVNCDGLSKAECLFTNGQCFFYQGKSTESEHCAPVYGGVGPKCSSGLEPIYCYNDQKCISNSNDYYCEQIPTPQVPSCPIGTKSGGLTYSCTTSCSSGYERPIYSCTSGECCLVDESAKPECPVGSVSNGYRYSCTFSCPSGYERPLYSCGASGTCCYTTTNSTISPIPSNNPSTSPIPPSNPDPNACEKIDNNDNAFQCMSSCTGGWNTPTSSQTGVYSCVTGICCRNDSIYFKRPGKGGLENSTTPPPSSGVSVSPPISRGSKTIACGSYENQLRWIDTYCEPPNATTGTHFEAAKAANRYYCDKVHYEEYDCKDGTKDLFPVPNSDTCRKEPWCPAPAGSSEGTGDLCPGGAGVVISNNKCPADKPLCNKPINGVQAECVAPYSKFNSQYCSRNDVCNSNYCASQGTGRNAQGQPYPLTSICAKNPSDASQPTCEEQRCTVNANCDSVCNDAGRDNFICVNEKCQYVGSGPTPTPGTSSRPTSTPAPTSTDNSWQADCPNTNSNGSQNICALNSCPAGYEPHSSTGTPGGTNGDRVCNYFEQVQTGYKCCTQRATGTNTPTPQATTPPTPTPTIPRQTLTPPSVSSCSGDYQNYVRGTICWTASTCYDIYTNSSGSECYRDYSGSNCSFCAQ